VKRLYGVVYYAHLTPPPLRLLAPASVAEFTAEATLASGLTTQFNVIREAVSWLLKTFARGGEQA